MDWRLNWKVYSLIGVGLLGLVLIFAPLPGEDGKYAKNRRELVEEIRDMRGGAKAINDTYTLRSIKQTPRHHFVRQQDRYRAYANRALPIGHGQTISQPYIVALMNQLAELRPGDKILEVGTGSGYHAATLSVYADTVYSLEIVKPLAERAHKKFEQLGYEGIVSRHGDGYYGWEQKAPFDAIIVTAAASHIPPPLSEQLKPGGKLVIPVGPPYQVQRLIVAEKDAAGHLRQRTVLAVRFVPMTRAEE